MDKKKPTLWSAQTPRTPLSRGGMHPVSIAGGSLPSGGELNLSIAESASDQLIPKDSFDTSVPERRNLRQIIQFSQYDFGAAARGYMLAKLAWDDMQTEGLIDTDREPDLREFCERWAGGDLGNDSNANITPEELRRLGWPKLEQLITELGKKTEYYKQAHDAAVISEQVLPIIRQIRGNADGATDAEPKETAKLFALAESVSNEPELLAAVAKKIRGEALEAKESTLLTAKDGLVSSLLDQAYIEGENRIVPCTTVYDLLVKLIDHWVEYDRIYDLYKNAQEAGQQAEKIDSRNKLIEYNNLCIEDVARIKPVLKKTTQLLDQVVGETRNKKITVTPELISQISAFASSLPQFPQHSNCNQEWGKIVEAAQQIQPRAGAPDTPEYINALAYGEYGTLLRSVTEDTKGDTELLLKSLRALQNKPLGQDSYDRTSDDFKNVYFGLRRLSNRLSYMIGVAKGFYLKMAETTKYNGTGWTLDEQAEIHLDDGLKRIHHQHHIKEPVDLKPAGAGEKSKKKDQAVLATMPKNLQKMCENMHKEGLRRQEELQKILGNLNRQMDAAELSSDLIHNVINNVVNVETILMQRKQAYTGTGYGSAAGNKGN